MPLNESGSNTTVQYTVSTTNTADGTILYWKTSGNTTNSDIVGGNTGSITITNNRAYINVTMVADASPDGTKTLGISLLTGSLNGTVVGGTSSPIVVNDTSNTPTSYTLYVWAGLTGDNTAITRSSPVQIGSNSQWMVSGPINIKSDGTLWTWQGNSYGQLGLNNTTTQSSPTQVGSLTDWTPAAGQESIGYNGMTTFIVKSNGTLWAWGRNSRYGDPAHPEYDVSSKGFLGLSDGIAHKSSPTQVGALNNWLKVNCQYGFSNFNAAAIKTDGTLWTWGQNGVGQLGLGVSGSGTYKSSPTQVGSMTNWSKIAVGGYCAYAIKTDGTLWAWGNGSGGQLGQNNTNGINSPVQVGALTNWTHIWSNGQGTVALGGGKFYYWGGFYDTFSSGSYSYRSSPTQIGTDSDWSQMTNNTLLKTNGTLWTWGYNGDGNLGINNRTQYLSPKQVGSKTSWVGLGYASAISAE